MKTSPYMETASVCLLLKRRKAAVH